jgi:hypothetical protein
VSTVASPLEVELTFSHRFPSYFSILDPENTEYTEIGVFTVTNLYHFHIKSRRFLLNKQIIFIVEALL